MTGEEAVQWVDQNRGMVINQAIQYINYTPYDVDDYIQDAYASAVEAAYCCQHNPKLIFPAVFKVIYRRMVAKVTPLPEEARKENKKKKAAKNAKKGIIAAETTQDNTRPYYSGGTSTSFPQNMRNDIELQTIHARKRSQPSVNLEKAYLERVRPNLLEKEQQLMDLSIGLTDEGSLSYAEIGKKLGISREAAKKRVTRTLDKIVERKLIIMSDAKDHLPKYTTGKVNPAPLEDSAGFCLAM